MKSHLQLVENQYISDWQSLALQEQSPWQVLNNII